MTGTRSTATALGLALVSMMALSTVGGAAALTTPAESAVGGAFQQDDQDQANVTFENQTASNQTVVVQSVTLPDGGFVVVHDESLLEGDAAGSVVGNSEYLEPGTHEDVEVTVNLTAERTQNQTQNQTDDGDQMRNQTRLRNETLIAMAHQDTNGNQAYDFPDSDGPYTIDGDAVVDQATVTFEGGGAQTTTTTTTTTATGGETNTTTTTDDAAGGETNTTTTTDEETTTTTTDEETTTTTDEETTTTTTDEETTTTTVADGDDETTTTTAPAGQPGFGIVVALLAAVLAFALARRTG